MMSKARHRVQYPKLSILLGTFIAAYLLHTGGFFDSLAGNLNGHGYVSILLGGALFSFGFTAAFGTALIINVAPHVHPVAGALIAGAGAAFVDMLLFSVVRFAVFHDEIHALRRSSLIRYVRRLLHHESISEHLRTVLLWSVAGFVIASPLPDEFGVTLISSVSTIHGREFVKLCYILNTLGIFAIIVGTRLVAY